MRLFSASSKAGPGLVPKAESGNDGRLHPLGSESISPYCSGTSVGQYLFNFSKFPVACTPQRGRKARVSKLRAAGMNIY
jgi:hypothetical protein